MHTPVAVLRYPAMAFCDHIGRILAPITIDVKISWVIGNNFGEIVIS